MKHFTITQIAKHFGLSRSTLLYYDKKEILQPSLRDDNNYRLYSESDYQALKKLCLLREIGIPLTTIAEILKNQDSNLAQILNQRLLELNDEIHTIRDHQRLIIKLLGNKSLLKNSRAMDKESWVELLRAAGMDEKDMLKWHQEFEKSAPNAHQDFLQSLGLESSEINRIREKSK